MPDFESIYQRVAGRTLVSRDRLEVLYQEAQAAPPGDFIEVGVYQGGTASLLGSLVKLGSVLYACDTFAGMPPGSIPGLDGHQEGEFAADRDNVTEFLSGLPVHIVPGLFPESAADILPGSGFALAHVDVGIYVSVRACCEALWPLILPGGVIIFDDYGFPQCHGAKKAVDEFFEGRAEVLPTGQALMRKLHA